MFTTTIANTCCRCQKPFQTENLAIAWTLCIWPPVCVLLLISLTTPLSAWSLTPALSVFHPQVLWCLNWCSGRQICSTTLGVVTHKILPQTTRNQHLPSLADAIPHGTFSGVDLVAYLTIGRSTRVRLHLGDNKVLIRCSKLVRSYTNYGVFHQSCLKVLLFANISTTVGVSDAL